MIIKEMKIKEQIIDSRDICKEVLTKVFGDDTIFDIFEYDTYCTLIEETLLLLKEEEK